MLSGCRGRGLQPDNFLNHKTWNKKMKKNSSIDIDSIKNVDPYQTPAYFPISTWGRKMIPDIESYIAEIEDQINKKQSKRMSDGQNIRREIQDIKKENYESQMEASSENFDKFSIYGGLANHIPNVYLSVKKLDSDQNEINESQDRCIKLIVSGMVKENSVSVEVDNSSSIRVRFKLEDGNNEIHGYYSLSDMEYSFVVNAPLKFIQSSVSAHVSGNAITLLFSSRKEEQHVRVVRVKYN